MKAVKIIATCFKSRKVIENTSLVGNPLGFFIHSQNFKNAKEIIDLLKLNIECEIKCDPGYERDLIIVNSDIGSTEGNDFLKSVSGMKIPGGKIITFNRKNIGRSFGAYSDAFLKFRNKYDYFLFTEDDILITKKNYLKKGIDIYNANLNCGFVAYISTTKIGKWHWQPLGLNKKTAYSCHGATGLSSKEMLDKIVQTYGHLPHNKGSEYFKDITFGEVAFPSSIIKLGYHLIDLPKDLVLAIPAYDIMRNIKYRKFPNTIEKFIYYTKSTLYKIFANNEMSLKIYIKFIRFIKFFF